MPTTPRDRYESSVDRIRELIAAGETYQVNHTMRLRSRVEGDPRGLYRDLCYAQRGAFSAYLDLGRYRILSASPELFFELRDGAIVTRPMKGTAPRGRWPEEDRAVAERLLASAKDRAENAMIVDLLRNDLGRISRHRLGHVGGRLPGRALRDRLAADHDRDLVELDQGVDLAGVFRGLFPSGSVTGAPEGPDDADHQRARGLAARRSTAARSATSRRRDPGIPNARFNVAIRTVTVDTVSATAEYGVGGGITWDSDAEAEYEETVAKARVLTARRPGFELLETMRHDPSRASGTSDRHLRRLVGVRRLLRLPRTTRPRSARPSRRRWRPRRPHRAGSGSRSRKDGTARVVCTPLASEPDVVHVALDDVPQDPRDVFLFHKTSRRQRYEEARRRHPDADDVVLINDRGEVTESTIANVAVQHRTGGGSTPPIEAGTAAGDRPRGRAGGRDPSPRLRSRSMICAPRRSSR